MSGWLRNLVAVLLALVLAAGLWTGQGLAADATPPASPVASPAPGDLPGVRLLTEADMPPGLVLIMDGDRTLDDVVANFADPAATAARYRAWGWQRNVVRAFHTPDDTEVDPSQIDGVYISVHVFGSDVAARQALDYTFDAHISGTNLEEIEVALPADDTRALYGRLPYGNEVTFYVQQGNLLIRLSASSPEGDPRAEATRLVEAMLAS